MKIKILGTVNSADNYDKSTEFKYDWVPSYFHDWEQPTPEAKGSVVICNFDDGVHLYVCCPRCGTWSYTGGHKIDIMKGVINIEKSLRMQCCEWHGHLKNNEFKEA